MGTDDEAGVGTVFRAANGTVFGAADCAAAGPGVFASQIRREKLYHAELYLLVE